MAVATFLRLLYAMSKIKVIGLNTDADGNARCIKAGYFKMGVANFLCHPNDGLTATCVIEIEIDDEQQTDIRTWQK